PLRSCALPGLHGATYPDWMPGRRWQMQEDPPERPADPAVRRANLRRVARLFRPYRGRLSAVLGLIIFSAALGVIPAFLLKEILNTAIPDQNVRLLSLLAGGVILISVLTGVLGGIQTLYSHPVRQPGTHAPRSA